MRIEQRYYLIADGTKLVDQNHPEAHSLLYPAGAEIADDEAVKWGLAPKPNLSQPESTKVVKPTSKEAPKGKDRE